MNAVQMRAIRTALGLSQVAMAKVLCVNRVTIGKYEGGKIEPSGTIAMCYAELREGWRPKALREVTNG